METKNATSRFRTKLRALFSKERFWKESRQGGEERILIDEDPCHIRNIHCICILWINGHVLLQTYFVKSTEENSGNKDGAMSSLWKYLRTVEG